MKIAVAGTRGFPNVQGGVEAHCENLYPLLAQKGCQVTVFARRPYLPAKTPYAYKGVSVVPLACPKSRAFEALIHTAYAILKAKKMQADILHLHAIGPAFWVPFARLLGLKVALTHHGPDYQRKKWGRLAKIFLKLGECLGAKYANAVITVSEGIATQMAKKYKCRVAIIPNGMKEARISSGQETLRQFGLTRQKYILAVGRFVPEKGFLDLLAAFEKLQAEEPRLKNEHWKLVIVGRADHPNRYSRELEKRAGANSEIVLTGFLCGERLQEIFSHAGIFALPSYYEGLPIVLLEALSYNLSCIASDIAANRETGLPDECYFTAGSISALTAKLKSFINSPLTEPDKQRQIATVKEKYSWAKIASQNLEVYQNILSE